MRKSSKGLTITEVLISTIMTGIVGVGVAVAAANFTQRNLAETSVTTNRVQLQRVVAYIGRDVRKAVRVATNTELALLPTHAGTRPILALWRQRDGNLSNNAGGCGFNSPYEFRAYYVVPSIGFFRGPNIIRLYVNNCPSQAVLTANQIVSRWTNNPATIVAGAGGADALTEGVATFTARDTANGLPLIATAGSTGNTNPSRISFTIQNSIDVELIRGGTTGNNVVDTQNALTANATFSRQNY